MPRREQLGLRTIHNDADRLRTYMQASAQSAATPTHALLSPTHIDTTPVFPPSQGSVVVADASNLWTEVPVGAAGTVFFSDGTDPAWVAAATTVPLPPVAEGDMLVADATPAWAVRTLGAAAGYALVSTATTVVWDQTPSWTGLHSFAAGITFSGASGANNVTIPDNVALAVELLDAGGLEYLRIVSSNAQPTINWNANSADIDWIIEAVGVADAFQVRGSNGEITLGALGAGVVQSTAAGVLSSGAVPLTDLASYAQGSIIIGGGADWEALVHPGGAGYALISDATELVWDLTPNWLGDHTWTSATSAKPVLTLENTNADGQAPTIDLYKNTASPLDGDDLGAVDFFGETSTGGKERYAFILAESLDVTNGDTGGGLRFTVVMDATERNLFEIAGYNGSVNQGEVIVNQSGQDVDFRVEGVGATNALLVQGSNGNVGVNVAAPSAQLHVDQSAATGTKPCLILDQGDASEQCIQFTGDGADQDIFLFTVDVTGTPTLLWNESEDALIISGADLHMNSGAADTVKIRRSGDVQNTAADLFFESQGGLAADSHMHIFIDADNNESDRYFGIHNNAETVAGATELFRFQENGNLGIGTQATPNNSISFGTDLDTIGMNTADGSDTKGLRITGGGAYGQPRGASIQLLGNERGGSPGDLTLIAGNVTGGTINFFSGGSQQMIIDDDGSVGIGATAGPTANGGNVLFFGDNTADPTMAANTAGFYGKDVGGTVEAFAVDEAGNAAQLTPHNFTLFDPDPTHGYPWSYYAKNEFIGKEINVDLYGAIKAIEALTGGQFIFERDIPKRAWPTEKAPPAWMLERMN